MAATLGALGFLAFLVVVAAIAYRMNRGPVPRRRVVKRLRADLAAARLVHRDVEDVLDRYRNQLDEVGEALEVEVRGVIRRHDRELLEKRETSGNESD